MRKLLSLFLILCLLPLPALAEELSIQSPERSVHPGQAVILSFTAPAAGEADLYLADASGSAVFSVTEAMSAQAGLNQLYWNGTFGNENAPEGDWQLTVSLNGETAAAPVTVAAPVPVIYSVDLSDSELKPRGTLTMTYNAGEAARAVVTLRGEDSDLSLPEAQAAVGENQYQLTGLSLLQTAEAAGLSLTDGDYSLTLSLMDEDGLSSTEEYLDLSLTGFTGVTSESLSTIPEEVNAATMHLYMASQATSQKDFTPSWTSPEPVDTSAVTYWNTPMDITDTERVWEMLTSPITILDSSKTNAEKRQVIIRAEPNEDAEGVGVVTCITQGVRVLSEDQDGWTKIETYSSSFHDSAVKAWNMLVQGWIPTRYLKTQTPNQHMGIVIDKLTQRLYLFIDGELYDTLLVSTGLSNERQPYNETRSGEFLLTSKVGEFRSDNLYCSLAIRFNSGDLLHEVPHTKNADGSKNYKNNEPKLGTRASHGCIRVQRKRTSKGINMQWIWDNIKKNTRLVIWEDWQGRQIPYPDDDTVLYYNADGGTMYHSSETCNSTKSGVVFTDTFTYGELEEEAYASLTTCDYCNPPIRKGEIDEINEAHAVGGDHDPILTAAREKFLNGEYD